MKKEFQLTEAEFNRFSEYMVKAQKLYRMGQTTRIPPKSNLQKAINTFWRYLADKYGFEVKSVEQRHDSKPGSFYATPKATLKEEAA